MTSEVDTKTSEFLRRRKLRLQQVREQSKEIAKKIRQRAKVENLRQVIELDAKKKREYLQKQEKLVKKLEEYYEEGLENVGASHKNAEQHQDVQGDKVDLSKQRGKEAAAELRKKRQQVLDKQKEILDRKLHAREIANELSRDKSAAISKILSRPENKGTEDGQIKTNEVGMDKDGSKKTKEIERNDMATQWDLDEPIEWEPNIPTLSLPKDDSSVKESNNNNIDSKSDKSKRLDLFALSEEMPSSLRGSVTNQDRVPIKSSLTLISEYLQNRDLRLREPDTNRTWKKVEDFQSLKQTILRTRTNEGNVCQVHDDEVVPVPTWKSEQYCDCCQNMKLHNTYDRHVKNNIHSLKPKSMCLTLQKKYMRDEKATLLNRAKAADAAIHSRPILRSASSFRINIDSSRSCKAEAHKSSRRVESVAPKKSLVTMYNHATRDIRNIPCTEEKLVVRNIQDSDDAYFQALKESSTNKLVMDTNKAQENRSKVAMTKQNIEKEYRDTISFLNGLPKDKGNKPVKTAYMDDQRQQMQRNLHQQKLQQEYRKIEKECRRQGTHNQLQGKCRSPPKESEDFDSTDIQYSWMPVPESNNSLTVHTIPTSLKEAKSNSVKFSKVDSYHEYRSRHKHTPPTKENSTEKPPPKTQVQLNLSASDSESVSSESSVQSVRKDKPVVKKSRDLSDAERIIIYKILDSKADGKKTSKLIESIAKSLTRIEKSKIDEAEQRKDAKSSNTNINTENIEFEQLNGGIYKTVSENGDNIASMYYQDQEDDSETKNAQNVKKHHKHHSGCCRKYPKQPENDAAPVNWDCGDEHHARSRKPCDGECRRCCNIAKDNCNENKSEISAPTSTTSFKTATNKVTAPDDRFIKLVDDAGSGESGKFYIGASGLLKNNDYEVIIQLKKKGTENDAKPDDAKIIENAQNKQVAEKSVDKGTAVTSTQTSTVDFDKDKNTTVVAAESQTTEQLNNINLNTKNNLTKTENGTKVPSDSNITVEISKPVPKVSDKCVSTVETDALDVGKSQTEGLSRPATSTYTQTTFNSPNHRPTLYHMSSSTSTAYMSPPEIILPKFMRPGYQVPDEYMNDARNYAAGCAGTKQYEYSAEDCDCKKCIAKCHAKRHGHASRHRCSRTSLIAGTPPNTTRSGRSADLETIYFNQENENTANDVESNWDRDSKCSCSKCNNHKKSIHPTVIKHLSRNHGVTKAGPKTTQTLKKQKIDLKPDIKKYVDKLLVLNKESLKAVQIVDQDCSAVPTPGSSVIDVPNNMDKNKLDCENKLSLQKIQIILKQKILESNKSSLNTDDQSSHLCSTVRNCKNLKNPKPLRKRPAHKVKTLNISKKVSKTKTCDKQCQDKPLYSPPSTVGGCKNMSPMTSRKKIRSKSSPTPRLAPNSDTTDRSANSDVFCAKTIKMKSKFPDHKPSRPCQNKHKSKVTKSESSNHHEITSGSNESDRNPSSLKLNNNHFNQVSAQTSINADSEVNFMKLAEDKLQNMEKIADLTEKCTLRLSNLAKVLEEVRKNKSSAYSHITTSDASDSDQKSDKCDNRISTLQQHKAFDKEGELASQYIEKGNSKDDNSLNSTEYIPFLGSIPKPVPFKNVSSIINSGSSSSRNSNSSSPELDNADQQYKPRAKPPPALSRIHLKHGQDFVIPHELSTVVEVDSPMSLKLKSSRSDNKAETQEVSNSRNNDLKNDELPNAREESHVAHKDNPDLIDRETSQQPEKQAETSEDTKLQMVDINQFNEIMLKPFFSIQEYAKQCNIKSFDDGFNLDDIVKDDQVNDELSSLHSEASLPDVISELIKRNIISEPFKFDSGSNGNSTTISSESTISVLALSRARRARNKAKTMRHSKENIGETSDTMSFSSNPDLENAFKKLGMGWASSTLKKTKERLALSSSSNTSSSSLSQFKLQGFNPDVPELVTDTVSSVLSLQKPQQKAADLKNAEQQTSKNGMTVKEFLTSELAKKITFNTKSQNETDEFMTLYETRMPEEMKHSSLMVRDDNSLQGGSVRARTSTPVQLYKSMTYHSSSSSNVSNGLFSNVDDLSSVKATSNSMKHSTSDKDDLVIPNLSLRTKKPDSSKSD